MAKLTLNQHTFSFIIAETFRLFGIFKVFPSLFFNRQTRTCVLLLVLSAFIQANLVGCLILPMPASTVFEKPFKDETKALIRVGITTKEEVEKILGYPTATRQNDSIYIYAKPYIYMNLYLLFVHHHASTRDFQTHHLLIVQFDRNGIVKTIDHITGNDSKTQTGIYVADTGIRSKVTRDWGAVYTPTDASISQMIVLYAPSEIEAKAKQFLVPAGKSAIYAYCRIDYLEWFTPENAITKVSVSLDNTSLGDFGSKGFFYWIVDPGSHSMTVTPIYPTPQRDHSDAITLECIEGQVSFVELTWEWKGFFFIEEHAHLNIISDPDKGRQEILERRMILDLLTPID